MLVYLGGPFTYLTLDCIKQKDALIWKTEQDTDLSKVEEHNDLELQNQSIQVDYGQHQEWCIYVAKKIHKHNMVGFNHKKGKVEKRVTFKLKSYDRTIPNNETVLWSSEERRRLFHTRSRILGLSDVRSDFYLRNSNLLNKLNPRFLLLRLVLLVSPSFGISSVISSSESPQYLFWTWCLEY